MADLRDKYRALKVQYRAALDEIESLKAAKKATPAKKVAAKKKAAPKKKTAARRTVA